MPLEHGKSKPAFIHNLKAEKEAGKPMKQALAIAYNVKKRSAKMASGGMAHCAHGGPAYCNKGCYADGGEVEEMHPEHDSMPSEDAPKAEMQAMKYEHGMEEPMEDPEDIKMAKGGMMHPKNMAKAIMMAKGGMIDSEEALDKGLEMNEPMGSLDGDDNESMPLDHASEYDDRLTPADSESEEELLPKKDLLSRIMGRMKA